MRTAIAAIAACVMMTGIAHAQPAKACVVYVVIDDDGINDLTSETNHCNFESKVKFLVNNLSGAKLKVTIDNFKSRGDTCANNPTGGPVNLPLSDKTTKALTFSISGDGEDKKKYKIRAAQAGTETSACYKFDITLYDSDGEFITRLDPDLEITEPMGPPPTQGSKPKPPQR
jgi:hypothetical protein